MKTGSPQADHCVIDPFLISTVITIIIIIVIICHL